MEMGSYILSILFSQPVIIMSWGFGSPIGVRNGLIFQVDGFKHQGYVLVKYNDETDLFDVFLYDMDNQAVENYDRICAENLVELIDEIVEQTDDYEEDVRRWIEGL